MSAEHELRDGSINLRANQEARAGQALSRISLSSTAVSVAGAACRHSSFMTAC